MEHPTYGGPFRSRAVRPKSGGRSAEARIPLSANRPEKPDFSERTKGNSDFAAARWYTRVEQAVVEAVLARESTVHQEARIGRELGGVARVGRSMDRAVVLRGRADAPAPAGEAPLGPGRDRLDGEQAELRGPAGPGGEVDQAPAVAAAWADGGAGVEVKRLGCSRPSMELTMWQMIFGRMGFLAFA